MINNLYLNILFIILLFALIPVFIILLKPRHQVFSSPTFIRFSTKNRKYFSVKLFVMSMLVLSLIVFHFSIINSIICFFLLRKLFIEYQLSKNEEAKFLVYDYEGGILEYNNGDKSEFYYMNDIKSVTLHHYNFSGVKIADLLFNDQVIRVSSSLVDFDKVPFLNVEVLEVRNYYLNFLLPEKY